MFILLHISILIQYTVIVREQDFGLTALHTAASEAPNAPSDIVADKELFDLMRKTFKDRRAALLNFYEAAASDEMKGIDEVLRAFPHFDNFRLVRTRPAPVILQQVF